MAQAINLVTGVKFKSPSDSDKKKTTWILKALNGIEFMECCAGGSVDHAMFVHKGLTGWTDFKGSDGKDAPFNEDLICQIPPNILMDLSYEIQGLSSLTEKERKNLRSPVKSRKTPKRSTVKRATTNTVD